MKNIFYILLLLPTIIFAQYPSNSGQKITLGEQTTADGLVFRGVANDTNVITPFSDTNAYIILDTANSKFYHYNRTTTFWSLAGGGGDSGGVTSFSAGTTGLTPSTATTGAVTLGGTLAVANGGTGSTTKNFVDLTTTQTVAGAKTFNANVVTQKSLGATGSVYYGFSDNANNFKGYFGYGGSLTNRMALSNNAKDGIIFVVSNYNDSKVMLRLDSTYKVMIGGDISPDEVLDVNGNAKIRGNISAGIDVAQARLHVKGSGVTSGTSALKVDNSAGTNLLTVLDNGNVGIGTASPGAKLEVNGGIKISETQEIITSGMWYHSGLDRLKFTNPGGGFGFNNNANNAEIFTILNNGNVGIGTTNPISKFDVSIGNQTSLGLFSASGHTITSSGGSIGNLYQISFGYGTGASYGSSAIAGLTESSTGFNTGALVFATRNQTTDVAPTERMRITSDGNVNIGTSISTGILTNGSTTIGNINAKSFLLGTTGTEVNYRWQTYLVSDNYTLYSRSYGDVLSINYTTGAFLINSQFQARNTTSATPAISCWNAATSGDNKLIEFYTEAGGNTRGNITYNRAAGLVSYNTTSDRRAKTILGEVASSNTTIYGIKVYDAIMKDATVSRPMFIADELELIVPYAVTGTKDAVDKEGKPIYQQVDVSSLIPIMVKAIQELKAEIDILKQEIINLKNK